MNQAGKALVLINLALSVILLTWALVLFLRPVDWGWKEARKVWNEPPEGKKEPNERVASLIDERVAAYGKLREFRSQAVARARQAAAQLAQAEGKFGANRLAYAYELDRLANDKGKAPLQIKEVQYNKDGTVATQGNRPWAQPVLNVPVPGVSKSYVAYLADLQAKGVALADVTARIAKGLAEQEKLTVRLNGVRDKDGKAVEPGYYDLLEIEAEAYKKLKEEREYLQPLWVAELYNAQLLRSRRQRLEKRLVELGADPSAVLQK